MLKRIYNFLHTEGVTGSNPVSPIILKPVPTAGFILFEGMFVSVILAVYFGQPGTTKPTPSPIPPLLLLYVWYTRSS